MNATLRIAAALLALLFSAGSLGAAPESAYNRGVNAYRAKDYAAARIHWARAVGEDVTHAFNNLGFLYFMGWGGKKDVPRAIALWTKAAERGHDESQFHLGHAYEEGEGVPRSLVQAYAWYRSSLVNAPAPEDGSERKELERRRRDLVRLLGMMPVEQLGEAERLARETINRYPPVGDLKR